MCCYFNVGWSVRSIIKETYLKSFFIAGHHLNKPEEFQCWSSTTHVLLTDYFKSLFTNEMQEHLEDTPTWWPVQ